MVRTRSCLLALALTTLGCESRTLVGFFTAIDPIDPNEPDAGHGGVSSLPQVPPDPAFSFPDGVAGIWSGYLEGYALQSGSDVITLTLDQSESGHDQIHVVLGTAQPPPRATNAGQEWPPADYAQANLPKDRRGPFDGFSYAGHLVEWQGRRLKFSIASMEPWDGWCIRQTSYPRGGSSAADATFTCFPNIDCSSCATTPPPPASSLCLKSTEVTEVGPFVTCAQYINCNGVYDYCVCNAYLCEAPPGRDIAFDITFNSDTQATAAAGVVQFNSLITLRLFR